MRDIQTPSHRQNALQGNKPLDIWAGGSFQTLLGNLVSHTLCPTLGSLMVTLADKVKYDQSNKQQGSSSNTAWLLFFLWPAEWETNLKLWFCPERQMDTIMFLCRQCKPRGPEQRIAMIWTFTLLYVLFIEIFHTVWFDHIPSPTPTLPRFSHLPALPSLSISI